MIAFVGGFISRPRTRFATVPGAGVESAGRAQFWLLSDDFADCAQRPLDVRPGDVEVGHGAYVLLVDGLELDLVGKALHEVGGVVDREHDDVRLDMRGIDRDSRQRGQAFGEQPGVLVVLGEALDMVVERVQTPAAMPDWRKAPPSMCFQRQASVMSPREPASTAPAGAPRPLLKSIQAVSNPLAYAIAGTPEATTAFSSQAPSRWVRSLCLRETSSTSWTVRSGHTLPPPRLVVCSTETTRERGA